MEDDGEGIPVPDEALGLAVPPAADDGVSVPSGIAAPQPDAEEVPAPEDAETEGD